MKRFTLLMSILIYCSSNLISQEIKEEIFSLNFSKYNSKKFIVLKRNNQYIFKSINKEGTEVQNCQWKTTLNEQQIKKLENSIVLLIENKKKKEENHLYKLTRKRDEIELFFKNSKCSAKHKLYYFQKDCNRNFIMKMKIIEAKKLLSNFHVYNLHAIKKDPN